jgi:hypothetical protein
MDPSTGWDPAPAAILLIGDYGTTGNTIVSPIYNNYCASDNIYADVTGNMMPDVTFARMTAQDVTQLETMVTKFLDYERTPPTNPDFYNHPITALGWQTERWFQICSEAVGGFFLHEQGKSPVRINAVYSGSPSTTWSTATNTSVVVNKFGPNDLGYIPATPAELGGWTGGNATMVNNAINSGSFLLQHRDHGYEQGWGEPGYSSSNIDGLTNTDLTYVFSINCLTGKYNMAGECFAEKFHRYTYNGNNSGALGILAASEVSYSFVNDTFVWGMYDNMWPEFLPTYNSTPVERGILPAFANSAGKYFLQASSWPYNTSNKAVTYALFHHHGDAFTTIYSEVPQDLTVSHDPVLLSGVTTFNVTANAGALIAMSVAGELIGVTEGTGSPVSLTIDAQVPPTDIDLVITLQNYYRYETVIPVIPPNGPYVVYDSHVLNDPAGNGNGMLDYGETVTLDFTVSNVGSDQANNVDVTISSTDGYVTILDATADFGNIGAGATSTVNDAFEFEVAGDVPDGHVIAFVVEADGGTVWESYFSVEALAPVVEYLEFLVNDTASGNGDYMWDPGEEVDIYVTLENNGSSEALNVEGILSSTDPFVTINTTSVQMFGDLSAGSNAEVFFNAVSDAATPEAHQAAFTINYTADLGISGSGTFSTQIGGYLIEEYFDGATYPPEDWSISGANPGNWSSSSTANAGGSAPESKFSWTPSFTNFSALTSPIINTTGSSSLALSYKHFLNDFSGSGYTIGVKTTSDGGTTWNTVYEVAPTGDIGPELLELTVETSDVGSATFQIAFFFDGYSFDLDYYYIDDIILGGGTASVVGTVSGVVTDIETGLPIEGADVAGMATSSSNGSYSFDFVVGTYDFTCAADDYFDLVMEDVEIEEAQTTTLNFAMNPSNPPENVDAEIVDYNDVVITWDVPADMLNEGISTSRSGKRNDSIRNEASSSRSLAGYKVYEDGTEIVEITDPATLTYTDAALDAGDYEYTVTAVYDNGETNHSDPAAVTVTLPAPIGVTAQSQEPNIVVSWGMPTRAVASYKIYRDDDLLAEDVLTSPYEDLDVPSGTYTYNVVTVFDGGWESDMSDDAVVDHTDNGNILKPEETMLSGNFPNPFNPTTTISFTTKEAGHVSINIFNMKGQLVRTLVNENLDAAYHSSVWNGKDNSSKTVSSGIYFYKMKASNYTATKKMILMK